jgi:hypothetical protein
MGRIENSDLSIQKLLLRKWEYQWDDRLKAHVERIAEEMGCTWWDIVMENLDLFLSDWDSQEDSVPGTATWQAELERRPIEAKRKAQGPQ